MNKFSVIIPTMWLSDYLPMMVKIYDKIDMIDEIIIIDNNPNKKIELESTKINSITKGENIYVNPAWNLGVKTAKNDYIIIANDDLLFNLSDLNMLINTSLSFLNDNVVLGPSMECFKETNIFNNEFKIEKYDGKFTFGFGTFMIMKKTSYTIIPDDILIFHGDVIQHETNDVFIFSGIKIETPMSTTLKSDQKIRALSKLDYGKSLKYNKKDLNKFK